MLYNPFNFQSNDNWDTDGLYWYNEFYTKKPVWTSLNQFHGPQKTGPRWSGLVPTISGLVLDRLRSMVARFGGKKPDWTGLANTSFYVAPGFCTRQTGGERVSWLTWAGDSDKVVHHHCQTMWHVWWGLLMCCIIVVVVQCVESMWLVFIHLVTWQWLLWWLWAKDVGGGSHWWQGQWGNGGKVTASGCCGWGGGWGREWWVYL